MLIKAMRLTLLAFTILTFCPHANAQDSIKPEKRALIKEILTLTQSDKIGEVFASEIFSHMEKEYPNLISQTVSERSDLTKAEKEKAIKEASEQSTWFMQRMRELFPLQDEFSRLSREGRLPDLRQVFY
jgi:hypothetical protein